MNRKNLRVLLALALVLGLLSGCAATPAAPVPAVSPEPVAQPTAAPAAASGEPIVAVGEAMGKHGNIQVQVTALDGVIVALEVLAQEENALLGPAAFEGITERVLGTNSLNVDAVSGSTETSIAYLAAIEQALSNGGITLGAAKSMAAAAEAAEQTYDVVILGAGGAGMAAAVEASMAGASVVVVEKAGSVGGNTTHSGSYNGSGTRYQAALGIPDTADQLYEDVMAGGDNLSNPDLVRVFADNAGPTVEWTVDTVGVVLNEEYLGQFDAAAYPRSHIPIEGSDIGLTVPLKNKCDSLGVSFKMNTAATELIVKDGAVVGAKAVRADGSEITFHANKGVILATGGFAGNLEMVGEYCPEKAGYLISTNIPSATGDGIVMAKAVGANLVGMEYVQTNPSGDPVTGALALYNGYGKLDGGIAVNLSGKRFGNEGARRDVQCANELAQEGGKVYLVWGKESAEKRGLNTDKYASEYNELVKNGTIIKADTLEECAAFYGINEENLLSTIARYNEMVEKGVDEDFGRTNNFQAIKEGPYFIGCVTPSVHHTMGGVQINTDTQVINTAGEIIPGLFAAGEVTGGIHGSNRLGGNAVTDALVFGRIAGINVLSN